MRTRLSVLPPLRLLATPESGLETHVGETWSVKTFRLSLAFGRPKIINAAAYDGYQAVAGV